MPIQNVFNFMCNYTVNPHFPDHNKNVYVYQLMHNKVQLTTGKYTPT